MKRRALLAALVPAVVLAWALPASAHVEIVPDSAPKGGGATVAFQVPNEMDNANTTQLQVVFPEDQPIASATVQPVPGWTAKVETRKLSTPIKGDDGDVTEVVSQITWSGGQIQPGQFQQFPVDLDGLPDNASALTFKALQTYSNGTIVRWIEVPTGGVEPEHPAPVLKLTAAEGASESGTSTPKIPKDIATTSDVDSAKTIGIIGIVVGALGLIAGITALVLRRKA